MPLNGRLAGRAGYEVRHWNFRGNPAMILRSTTCTLVQHGTRYLCSVTLWARFRTCWEMCLHLHLSHFCVVSTRHLRVQRETCYSLQSYCTQFPFDTCHLLQFKLAYRTAVLLRRLSVGWKEISTGPSSCVLLLFLNFPNHMEAQNG